MVTERKRDDWRMRESVKENVRWASDASARSRHKNVPEQTYTTVPPRTFPCTSDPIERDFLSLFFFSVWFQDVRGGVEKPEITQALRGRNAHVTLRVDLLWPHEPCGGTGAVFHPHFSFPLKFDVRCYIDLSRLRVTKDRLRLLYPAKSWESCAVLGSPDNALRNYVMICYWWEWWWSSALVMEGGGGRRRYGEE